MYVYQIGTLGVQSQNIEMVLILLVLLALGRAMNIIIMIYKNRFIWLNQVV